MNNAALASQTRRDVEAALARNVPSALSPRERTVRERMASGVEVFDELLAGGLPVGAISELVGVTGSGRTTVAVSFAAAAARAGKVAAWIDVSDALHPASAAHNGVDLSRLLWVRCKAGVTAGGSGAEDVGVRVMHPAAVPTADAKMPLVKGAGGLHPRTESLGMPEAIQSVLRAHGGLQDYHAQRERKMIGTPGAPNRPLTRSPHREEQVASDRRPTRKAQHHLALAALQPRCAEPVSERRSNEGASAKVTVAADSALKTRLPKRREGQPWTALDRALRATDLLLQAGGFGLIVLDLGDTPAEMAWRIPLATWFRYRAGCDRARTSLLVLTQYPCARSSAELVVKMPLGEMKADGNVLAGFVFRAEVERQRFAQEPTNLVSIRRPPQSAKPGQWFGRAAWAI